jgi:hypothetical protein
MPGQPLLHARIHGAGLARRIKSVTKSVYR